MMGLGTNPARKPPITSPMSMTENPPTGPKKQPPIKPTVAVKESLKLGVTSMESC